LAQLDTFLQGPVPEGPDVILTGEYTPFNLLHHGGGLSAVFDFGDGLVGPRECDWLGTLCFLAAGDAARIDALFDGCHGRPFDRGRRARHRRGSRLACQRCRPCRTRPGSLDAAGAAIEPRCASALTRPQSAPASPARGAPAARRCPCARSAR